MRSHCTVNTGTRLPTPCHSDLATFWLRIPDIKDSISYAQDYYIQLGICPQPSTPITQCYFTTDWSVHPLKPSTM